MTPHNVPDITKLIDIPALQKMMEDLFGVTKIGFALIDLEGKILAATGWQEICTDFHRRNSLTFQNCLESDLRLTEGVKEGEYRIYKCKNGLNDLVTPLFIGGQHIANIFSGQFFFEDETVDKTFFAKQSEKYGFEKEAYLNALLKVPRWQRNHIEVLMRFYTKLTYMLSKTGLGNLQLTENQEDLNRAQAVAKTGSWRVRVNGDLFWSEETYRMFGIPSVTKMTYDLFLETIHPDDRKYVADKWQAALKGEPYNVEHRIIVEGKTYWVNEKAEIEFDSTGKLLGGFGTVQDITEQKTNQEALEQAQNKLQEYATNLERIVEERTKRLQDSERLAAIGQTAGMVGHDIRNPLQAIVGDLYFTKKTLNQLPENEQKQSVIEDLDAIEKNIAYINKIVADLQDFARPLNPHAETTNLKQVIDDLLSTNDLPTNVKVSVKVETENVVTDSTFINRIMYNLVNNAVQAMPNGGKLTIHSFKEANDLVIQVKDTGAGIPEAVKDKLFTPMFTTKSKGQGFGLVVVKRMTESLGGTVTFDSQEGKGTTFAIRLPITH